jgi:Phytanoyl-CoA dioxygenase (PhyH)
MIMLGRQSIREVTLVSRTPTRLPLKVGTTTISFDIAHLREFGWVRINGAIPVELCDRVVEVLESEVGVPVHDQSRWDDYGGEPRDFVPVWGHQAQWDIRQHPNLHAIWATLYENERLYVSLDSCRFTPPWKPLFAEPYGIHWDHDPRDAEKRIFQGVMALTDTAIDQGGFRCVPSLYHDRDAWPSKPTIDADGDENWLADIAEREIVHVPTQAGDLIVWNSLLAHGNSKNFSSRPRMAFYVGMGRADHWGERVRQASVESWRTGRCVPWWRNRPGYDRVEPWSPAILTEIGRRLLGLEKWPDRATS